MENGKNVVVREIDFGRLFSACMAAAKSGENKIIHVNDYEKEKETK